MPRRPRLATGGIAYYVLNRRVGRLALFEKPGDHSAFEKVLGEAYETNRCTYVGILFDAEHWYLLLWARDDGELSEMMRWIKVTHAHRVRRTAGRYIRDDSSPFRFRPTNILLRLC
jgi:putative transposase